MNTTSTAPSQKVASAITSLLKGSDPTLDAAANLLLLPPAERRFNVISALLRLPIHTEADVGHHDPRKIHPRTAKAGKIIIATIQSFDSLDLQTDFLRDLSRVGEVPASHALELKVVAGLTLFSRERITGAPGESEMRDEPKEQLLHAYALLLANARRCNLQPLAEYYGVETGKEFADMVGTVIASAIDNGAGMQILKTFRYVRQMQEMLLENALAEIVKLFGHKALHRMPPDDILELFDDVPADRFPFVA